MTEYNLFCYSIGYNDKDSFQQEKYRCFNKVVGKERYGQILGDVRKIIPNSEKLWLFSFWKSITRWQWQQLLSIPEAKDFKGGFEYISGVKLEGRTIVINGKTIDISEDSFQNLKNQLNS